MPPRIVRPRSDSPYWSLSAAGVVVASVVGYWGSASIFRPGVAEPMVEANVPGHGPAVAPPVERDSGTRLAVATPAPAPVVAPAPPALADVQVGHGVLTGCGDTEEINLVPGSCDEPAGLEPALRRHLQVLATCPAAEAAAREPRRVLSLGLKVDFPRRRVAVLLGRSSSVPDKVSYVACARTALSHLDDLWRLQAAHPRYLFYFAAHFAPRAAGAAPVPAAPEVAPAPVTATPASTPTSTPTPAPTPTAPTTAGGEALPDLAQATVVGEATVVWERLIVRDAPREGAIVTRLPQGAAVSVLNARQGSWYGIRWERGQHGWAYGPAIGR